jgi:hypothetical protein
MGRTAKGFLIAAAIPTVATVIGLTIGAALGIATVGSPGMVPIVLALVVNLPGAVVLGVLMPGFFMAAGEDPFEVVFLIMATPISCLIYGIIGCAVSRMFAQPGSTASEEIVDDPPSGETRRE